MNYDEHELRQTVEKSAVLLRKGYHVKSGWRAIRVQICVRTEIAVQYEHAGACRSKSMAML